MTQVNCLHGIIVTGNPYPYTAKYMCVNVTNILLSKLTKTSDE